MRGNTEFQFERDISLYRDPDDSDMINLILKGDSATLLQIITSIKFVGFDERKPSQSNFVFGNTVCLKNMRSIELVFFVLRLGVHSIYSSSLRMPLYFVLLQGLHRGSVDEVGSHAETRFSPGWAIHEWEK